LKGFFKKLLKAFSIFKLCNFFSFHFSTLQLFNFSQSCKRFTKTRKDAKGGRRFENVVK
tara:strand:- start:1 stop:177 length:177 start_codon:yes stop_codon:yes gene_type:complete